MGQNEHNDSMGLFSALLAALFASVSNFFMRRSLDAGGTTKGFLAIQMTIAFLSTLVMGPLYQGIEVPNLPITGLGLFAGVILAIMLRMLGNALETGPAGFTFSILSSATVMPAIFMAALFGASFGFIYTASHGIGSLLVLAGLFWAGKGLDGMKNQKRWLLFAASMFALHVVLLLIFQWRALLLRWPHPEEIASYFHSENIRSVWFMPMYYLGSALCLTATFLRGQRRWPLKQEWFSGCMGGVANALCTLFLIQSTELARGAENAIIFPIFSIGAIFFSNWWSQKIYQEKVHWRACQLSALGLFIGTVDWKILGL